jgi:hypothetical protein
MNKYIITQTVEVEARHYAHAMSMAKDAISNNDSFHLTEEETGKQWNITILPVDEFTSELVID